MFVYIAIQVSESFIDAEYSYQLYTRNERAHIATCN